MRDVGRAVFALVMIGVGLQGLVSGGFGAIWLPVPHTVPPAIAWLCDAVCIVGGIGLLWRSTLVAAALPLLLAIWYLAFRLPAALHAPGAAVSWEGSSETLVIATGAWAAVDFRGVRIARILMGLGLIAFGVAHFAYLKQTAALVPHWLPSPTLWVEFTGAAYIAAGLALVAGVRARLAAALAAAQMGLFTLLVWLPPLAAGARDAGTVNEAIVSAALTAAAWALAQALA